MVFALSFIMPVAAGFVKEKAVMAFAEEEGGITEGVLLPAPLLPHADSIETKITAKKQENAHFFIIARSPIICCIMVSIADIPEIIRDSNHMFMVKGPGKQVLYPTPARHYLTNRKI
jgi:hypothetical protein